MKNLQEIYLRISPKRFHYLKFILEGYDNLAILSSFDNKTGVVIVRYATEQEQDIYALLVQISPQLIGN